MLQTHFPTAFYYFCKVIKDKESTILNYIFQKSKIQETTYSIGKIMNVNVLSWPSVYTVSTSARLNQSSIKNIQEKIQEFPKS